MDDFGWFDNAIGGLGGEKPACQERFMLAEFPRKSNLSYWLSDIFPRHIGTPEVRLNGEIITGAARLVDGCWYRVETVETNRGMRLFSFHIPR